MQEFHAFMVSPGKEHQLEIPESCGFHLSVLALPRGANGKTTVYVSVDGKSYALASLDSQQNILQVPTDLIFNYEQKVTFFAKGSATVHAVGYRQTLDLSDDDEASPFGVPEDDSEGEDEEAVKLPVDAIEGDHAASASEEEGQSEEGGDSDEEAEEAEEAEEEESDEAEEGEESEEEEEADSDIAQEPASNKALHVDPTAPSSSEEEDEEMDSDAEIEGEDEEESDEEVEEDEDDDSDDEEIDEVVEEDDEEEDEESAAEAEEPPMKVVRAEGNPSKTSPQRPSGGSPQGRKSGGESPQHSIHNSPQGRKSGGGSPQHSIHNSPQGRKSGGGSPQHSNHNSPQGRKSGGSPQGRRSA